MAAARRLGERTKAADERSGHCDGGVDVSDGRSGVAEGGVGGARGRGVAGLMGLANHRPH